MESEQTGTVTTAPAATVGERPSLLTPGRRKLIATVVGIAGLILLLLGLQGTFKSGKVMPGIIPVPAGERIDPDRFVLVEARDVDDIIEWPGTVRSRSTVLLAPKLLARIRELRVEIGSPVKAGDDLVVLDDRDLTAKVDQAKAAGVAAAARSTQAEAEYNRVKGLFGKEAATQRDLEAAQARSTAASAQVEQARHALEEVKIVLSEAVLRAPFDAVVTDKWAQAGDTAVPGKPVLALQDPHHLRLEASVPERAALGLKLGAELRVRMDALGTEVPARIDEIAPSADPESRTFLVKADLTPDPAIRPGMFGRFLLVGSRRSVLLVPATAVRRAGQLEQVRVFEDGEARIRQVRTGKVYGGRVEVLSGLRAGDRVLREGP